MTILQTVLNLASVRTTYFALRKVSTDKLFFVRRDRGARLRLPSARSARADLTGLPLTRPGKTDGAAMVLIADRPRGHLKLSRRSARKHFCSGGAAALECAIHA